MSGSVECELRPKFRPFGDEGLLQSNDPAGQEKAIIYNELVANAVALQNVVDQTQALHALKSEGAAIEPADLPYLSLCHTELEALRGLPDGTQAETGPAAAGVARVTR